MSLRIGTSTPEKGSSVFSLEKKIHHGEIERGEAFIEAIIVSYNFSTKNARN